MVIGFHTFLSDPEGALVQLAEPSPPYRQRPGSVLPAESQKLLPVGPHLPGRAHAAGSVGTAAAVREGRS